MRLNLNVDLPISAEDETQLAGIFGVSQERLADALTEVAIAALEEYVRMFLGQKVFTRGADMIEYRLFLLIRSMFGNSIPDEQRVCDLFQATSTQARSLIRSVLSKYQYELHEAMTTSLRAAVEAAEQVQTDGDYEVAINTQSIVEGLNRLLGHADGALHPIVRKRGTVSTYVIKPSAYLQLRAELGLDEA